MSCGVGFRCGLDLVLPWLWCRPAAVALIQPPAWEPPYATGAALKRKQTKKTKCLGVTQGTLKTLADQGFSEEAPLVFWLSMETEFDCF